MKTILATTYAVNPYKGSEDAMGWNYVTQIAQYNKVLAVTRENNEDDINKYMKENPSNNYDNITFIYYDLPYYLRFWKKGSRGALFYFYLWQLTLPFFIKKQNLNFDITHNLNFHNDWTPSWLWLLKKPMVWGPIGHHHKIPRKFILKQYGFKAYFIDRLKWFTKKAFWNVGLFLNITARKADKIICMNSSVQRVLKIDSEKVVLVNSVCAEPAKIAKESSKKFTALFVGRFVPLKGADVAIESFALFYKSLSENKRTNIELVLVGKGPEEQRLKTLASTLGISHIVQFIPWMERDQLAKLYARASVFFFPSHEGAGMVVPEALAYGLPVLTFDNYGPGEFIDASCGIKIPYGDYRKTTNLFNQALLEMYQNPKIVSDLSNGAKKQYDEYFSWQKRGQLLANIYDALTDKYKAKQSIKGLSIASNLAR